MGPRLQKNKFVERKFYRDVICNPKIYPEYSDAFCEFLKTEYVNGLIKQFKLVGILLFEFLYVIRADVIGGQSTEIAQRFLRDIDKYYNLD